MSKEEWVTICNVRILAEHYQAIADGKKDSYACNAREIAETLSSAAEMLGRLPRWIPASERLPDMLDEQGCQADVLGYFPEYPPSIAIVWWNGSRWEDTEGFTKAPTHWMPLPEPPEPVQ